MRIQMSVCALAFALLTGCSGAPSDSEIKQAILDQSFSNSAPNDISCSEDRDATKALREQMQSPQQNLQEINAINGATRSAPEQTWVMNCQTSGQTVRVRVGRGTDGKLRISA